MTKSYNNNKLTVVSVEVGLICDNHIVVDRTDDICACFFEDEDNPIKQIVAFRFHGRRFSYVQGSLQHNPDFAWLLAFGELIQVFLEPFPHLRRGQT